MILGLTCPRIAQGCPILSFLNELFPVRIPLPLVFEGLINFLLHFIEAVNAPEKDLLQKCR